VKGVELPRKGKPLKVARPPRPVLDKRPVSKVEVVGSVGLYVEVSRLVKAVKGPKRLEG